MAENRKGQRYIYVNEHCEHMNNTNIEKIILDLFFENDLETKKYLSNVQHFCYWNIIHTNVGDRKRHVEELITHIKKLNPEADNYYSDNLFRQTLSYLVYVGTLSPFNDIKLGVYDNFFGE